jgi:hypothetical protein
LDVILRADFDVLDTSAESKKKSEQALKELGGEEAFYGEQGKGE